MPNASAGGPPAPLPPELIPDFERFRSALGDFARAGGTWAGAVSDASAETAWREYGRLLHEKSAELSLIAKGDRAQLFTRHILDSLNPLSLFDRPPASALDVGSGGGLPGLPLAIAWPEARVVLLESRERKAGFLEHAVRTLGLKNVRVACARLEDLGSEWSGERVETVFVRAVGDLDRVLDLASVVARPGGRWVYFLGSRSAEESLRNRDAYGARVEEGAFGGRLLTGLFAE